MQRRGRRKQRKIARRRNRRRFAIVQRGQETQGNDGEEEPEIAGHKVRYEK